MAYRIQSKLAAIVVCLIMVACQTTTSITTTDNSLYKALGGQQGVERIVDQAIKEIQYDQRVSRHFESTNWDRFREKQIEHICLISGGGCTYTGDTMIDVHAGMNINEAEFNAIADNLMTAMEKLEIPVSARNRLTSIIAKLREEVIYR